MQLGGECVEAKFKKLTRFAIICTVCHRTSDCMAIDKDEAAHKFEERGWSWFKGTKADGEEFMVSACKVCRPKVLAMVPVSDAEIEKEN